MTFLYVFGVFVLGAYIVQVLLGMHQMKHFNQVYQALRQKGKVAIGRRAGKIRAGTIVLLAVDAAGTIVDARKMQGVTVLAKFHPLPYLCGEDIHYMDHYHPLVRQENKLLQLAIENAREIYLRVEAGNYQETQPLSPLTSVIIQGKLWKQQLQSKWKRSVK